MNISDRVVNVEVLLQVQRIDKLPRVLVEHEACDQGRCLHLAPSASSLQEGNVFKPGQGPFEAIYFLDVLVDGHQFQGSVQVKFLKDGLRCAEVLRISHLVVLLVLVAVQIRDSPVSLISP